MPDPNNATFPITAGPTKWDLAAALFEQRAGRTVQVKIECEGVSRFYNVRITSVQTKDHSGDAWNIEGLATLKAGIGMHRARVFLDFRTDVKRGMMTFLN